MNIFFNRGRHEKSAFLVNVWTQCSLVCGLVASLEAVAVTPDPLRQWVNAKPTYKTLQFSPTFEGRGDGDHICPVSGEKITNKNLKGVYFGRTVYFCCEGCLRKAQREPERYIKPSTAE